MLLCKSLRNTWNRVVEANPLSPYFSQLSFDLFWNKLVPSFERALIGLKLTKICLLLLSKGWD